MDVHMWWWFDHSQLSEKSIGLAPRYYTVIFIRRVSYTEETMRWFSSRGWELCFYHFCLTLLAQYDYCASLNKSKDYAFKGRRDSRVRTTIGWLSNKEPSFLESQACLTISFILNGNYFMTKARRTSRVPPFFSPNSLSFLNQDYVRTVS